VALRDFGQHVSELHQEVRELHAELTPQPRGDKPAL
jgi:hypothetical protein